MVRERASTLFPAFYFCLLAASLILSLIGATELLGFILLVMLALPWSLVVFFFLSWAMMHDNSMFSAGLVMFVLGALLNMALIYKFGYSVEYNATIGKE